ncbi:hypothetical protein CHH28_12875 [Bacterioplanes sanyensis]|uniref:C4-dicarboxylate ABC transporter substrate-binding protein n=1 Tax=Bacterioplanes sanyensis TaxID=1249553 RepID=A0A222FM98_9GAMM|nr:TRAP transporter substrate-binding protein DctP [Bacterioplanes sanyensis]ASP39511.1 hypothetical protein CHH28_12875 [Bacterioplanes sanyensis]
MPLSRRRFLAASVASAVAWQYPLRAAADSEYRLRFASPYRTIEAPTSPHMHEQIKEVVERLSDGRIQVDILENGAAGIGPELMAKVSRGMVDAALVSASNLSPIAPILDILNIPFWSASNDAYDRLVRSTVWRRLIVDHINNAGAIYVWFPYVVGARTLATGKHWPQAITHPDQLVDAVVRVPSSELLRHCYTIAGGRTRRVDWGEVSKSLQLRQIDIIDPSISSLYSGPDGLRHHIAHISQIESVHDGWMAVINQNWLRSLPASLQDVMYAAGDEIQALQPKIARQADDAAKQLFSAAGVDIHQLDDEQRAHWQQRCGHQHPSWRRFKRDILGNELLFDELLAAANGDA